MSARSTKWRCAFARSGFPLLSPGTLGGFFPSVLLVTAMLALGGGGFPAHGANPVRGLSTLPARPLSAGYLNALRRAGGTTAQNMASLNYDAVDLVLLGFARLNADASLDVTYGNFDLYQPYLVPQAHAHSCSVLMSIKGDFQTVSASPALRQALADNIVQTLETLRLDGVDFDWEWPDTTAERDQFTAMMQTVHATVKAHSPDYIVMFVQGPGYWLAGTDWGAVRDYSDFCFCIAYDWKNPANGPIRKPGAVHYLGLSGGIIEAAAKGAIDYIIGRGYPENQIIVGLPFYSSANSSWFNVAPNWEADRLGWLAAMDPNYLEVEFEGAWWTTPDCLKQKMNALLDPRLSVLADQRTVRGVGFWEFGHEDIAEPHLSDAIRDWRTGDRSLGGLASASPTNTTVLVERHASWRYLDTGSNLGFLWRTPTFDDSAWPSGLAPLGYGDGDEATLLNPGNGRITTYFRRAFQMPDPASIASLTLRLLRDDGAVVYLNGVEVFRSNMPTGMITATTLASSVITGAEETGLFHNRAVNPALLRAGTNLLAVEIHQSGTNSSDLSFDLQLLGQTDPSSLVLVPAHSPWRFLDTGSNLGVLWAAPGFDDGAWFEGCARLGYGLDGELTLVRFGSDPANKPITTYFRHTFLVADPSLLGPLQLHLQRDDGALIHLNGKEIFRSNMPPGPARAHTQAASTVGGADETGWISAALPNLLLLPGANVLAAEIHQASSTSSDIGFDLQLAATLQPRLTLVPQAAGFLLRWPAAAPGFHVQFSSQVGPLAAWSTYPATPVLNGSSYEISVAAPSARGFYRLAHE